MEYIRATRLLLELFIQRKKKSSQGAEGKVRPGSGAAYALPLVLLIKGSPGDKKWPTGHYAQHGCSTIGDMPTGVLSALCTRHGLYSSHVYATVAMPPSLTCSCLVILSFADRKSTRLNSSHPV